MTILELKDSLATLVEANDKIQEKADAEKRSLNSDERAIVEGNLTRIEDIELRLKNESHKDGFQGTPIRNTRHMEPTKEKFSLIKAINARINGNPLPEIARDLNTLGSLEFRNAGIGAIGDIRIPFEVRGDILAKTVDHGQEIVAEDKKSILPPLLPKLVFAKAGATYLTGLVGDVSVPSYAGTTVNWKGEVAAADDGGGTFSEVTLSPKRITAVIDVSKLFLAQDSVGAEALLLDNIAQAVALKLESTILGTEPISTTQPQGIGFAYTEDATFLEAVAAPTFSTVVGLETSVDTTNALMGNLAYITNGKGRGILKTTPAVSGVSDKMLLEDGQMNGYPVLVTNSCSASAGAGSSGNLLVFGNWADLVIGQWGGYDITVDPYTVAPEGQVRIVINAYFDAKGLRGSRDSGSGTDNYANSFDALAII